MVPFLYFINILSIFLLALLSDFIILTICRSFDSHNAFLYRRILHIVQRKKTHACTELRGCVETVRDAFGAVFALLLLSKRSFFEHFGRGAVFLHVLDNRTRDGCFTYEMVSNTWRHIL